MKKLFTLTLLFVSLSVFSQDKFKIFRFNPGQLVTSTLSMGLESFNESKSHSNIINLGIRYNGRNNFNYYGVLSDDQGNVIDQYDTYKGLTLQYEHRFYIPSFIEGKPSFLNREHSDYGVYLAPNIRFDYNYHDFDNSYFENVPSKTNPSIYEFGKVINTGKSSIFGIMPAINLGFQFNVFQYGYVDLYLGGGLRINNEKEIARERSGSTYANYSISNGAIERFILNEGVIPTGGITFGVKIR